MIISRLNGGLGNQLFQYAAGRRLAIANQTELKLDLSAFENNNERSFELKYFNIQAEIAPNNEISALKRVGIGKIIDKLKSNQKRSLIKEKSFRFDSKI